MKKLLLALMLLTGFSTNTFSQMQYITNCVGTTSCTASNTTGDLEVALAGRNGGSGSTPATFDGTWTSVGTANINGSGSADSSVAMACKVTTSSSEASGTVTNAGTLVIHVYRGQKAGNTAACASTILGTPSFFKSTVNTTTTTETFNSITTADSTSWVAGFGYCSGCTAGINTAPSGMTNRSSSGSGPAIGGHDTNAGVASFSTANVTLTTAGRILTGTVEIKTAPLLVSTPTYNNDTGTYNNDVSVTISVSSPASVVICYTTDGSTPAATTPGTCSHGTTYSTPVSITATGTVLKSIGTKAGYTNSSEKDGTYTLTVGAVSASPVAGSYANDQTVTLSVATTTGATIHYTTNGDAVTCSSTTYSGAISVTGTETIKAIGCKTNYNSSAATSDTYTLTVGVVSASPSGGGYANDQSVTLSVATTTGATIHYTSDGSAVSCGSGTYSGAISVTATTTIKAIGCKSNYTSSAATSDTYTLTVGSVTASPVAGTYSSTQSVSLSVTNTTGSTIHYTTNSSTPDCSSTAYSTAISIAATTTLKAIACKTGYTSSGVFSGIYTIGTAPVASDSLTITEKSGSTTTNYPVRVGRPFTKGEWPTGSFPKAVVDATAVATQVNVKNLWDDGSIKFALISFLIPTLNANATVAITFTSQANCNCSSTMSQATMLGAGFNFDAQIQMTQNSVAHNLSARTILTNASSCTTDQTTGCYIWAPGPIAQTVVLADNTSAAAYDVGWKDIKYTALKTAIGSGTTSVNVWYPNEICASLPRAVTILNDKSGNGTEAISVTACTAGGNPLTITRSGTPAPHDAGSTFSTDVQASTIEDAPNAFYKSFRPEFECTFWATINKVSCKVIGENANTTTLQDLTYALTVTTGNTGPTTQYGPTTITHTAMSRWALPTGGSYWIGTAPSTIDVNHNLAYLAQTTLIPNYDTTRSPSAGSITNSSDAYTGSTLGLFAYSGGGRAANFPVDMSETGQTASDQIGLITGWGVQWLYTGDNRMQTKTLGNADRAMNFPLHFREGATGKFFDTAGTVDALGKVISIAARPTIYIGEANSRLNTADNTSSSDVVGIVAPLSNGGFAFDFAHQPPHYFIAYLLTGQFLYLEEMQFWAALDMAAPSSDTTFGRGPSPGSYGGLPFGVQTRGQAWGFRNRYQAEIMSVDSSAENAYFNQKNLEFICEQNGVHAITKASPCNSGRYSTAYDWGANTYGPIVFATGGRGTLGWWVLLSSGLGIQTPVDPTKANQSQQPWEHNFLTESLGYAKQLGLSAVSDLFSYVAANLIGQITDAGYSPKIGGSAYASATLSSSDTAINSWATVKSDYLSSYNCSGAAPCFDGQFDLDLQDAGSYPAVMCAAASFVYNETNGVNAWAQCVNLVKNQTTVVPNPLEDNPKNAFLPVIPCTTPSTLAFGVQPSNTHFGSIISPGITVQVLDASNCLVTTATNSIAMAIGTNPSSGTLTITTPVSAAAGTATFSDASIDNPGTGYTLSATSAGLTTATSSTFNVTGTTATHFSVTLSPNPPVPGAFGTITVTALNSSNAVVTSYTGTAAITSSDSLAGLPANITSWTGGVGTASVALKTVGSQTITATDSGNSLTGTSSAIIVPQLSFPAK